MGTRHRSLALKTGTSTGIGYEPAKRCTEAGFDLLLAVHEAAIHRAAVRLRIIGVSVEHVEGELAATNGVDRFYGDGRGRPIDVLMANAWHGLYLRCDMN